jgi:Ca2+-transporting ATPase
MWQTLNLEQIFQQLKTSKSGLSFDEAKERLKKYGPNKLPEPKQLSRLTIFLSQFKDPLIIILLAASVACLFFKDRTDFLVIIIAVFLNTLIGYFQEEKAEKAIYQLRKMVEHKAKVIRNNEEHLIPSFELVPGDIILLEAGDIVLADARIIESYNLQTIEAVLTGESKPSNKKIEALPVETPLADQENMVFAGTTVSRGKGRAVVVKTGLKTELGKIASLIKETKKESTPLQKKMGQLAKIIGLIVVSLAFLLFLIGLFTGREFLEILLTSIAVAVAGVPEGLVIAITVCLVIGMQRILKKKALVRKIVAAETLGSVTVICSDKTGTLTKGEMNLFKIINFNEKDLIYKIFLLCHSLIVKKEKEELKIIGDETEKALFLSALENGLDYKKIYQNYQKIDEIPFDSERMWMATLHEEQESKSKNQKSKIIFVKGAPEKIIKMSKLDDEKIKEIESKYLEFAKQGLRVLAMAYKKIEENKIQNSDLQDLTFAGLVVLKDPLRKEAKETIKECQLAGIRPIVVTGDHKLTAKNIAQELGLKSEEILEGKELDKMNDLELSKKIKEIDVFARVEPKHKIRIVDLLQKNGEVVAMTGDGVNDAPAIKSADIGIALGSGTDVTKETADLVLLDNNFKTIVEAVKEGRGIFDNIKKIVLYLMASSFTEIILVGLSLFWGLPLSILPAQILWVNIIEDSFPALALTYEKASKEVIKEKPRDLKVPILDKEMKFLIFGIGIITDLILFGLFLYLWGKTKDLTYIRTMIFVGLGIDSLFYVFACKNLKKNIWQYNPFDNKFLNLSVAFGFFMFFVALYLPFFQKILKTVPLNFSSWLILISLGLINLTLIELGKLIFKNKKV